MDVPAKTLRLKAEIDGRADMAMVRRAYARLADIYDISFGPILRSARMATIASVNRLPGVRVLEVGVGTGLALPFYDAAKRVTGIDVSSEMLLRARNRVAALHLATVEALLEMDAQDTLFPADQFDIAVAMFVASVVPDPQAMLAELRRVVKPGGMILLVNHCARTRGPVGWCERAFAPVSVKLGWHADFRFEDILSRSELRGASILPMRPFGLFQLVELRN
jgi:phosphatidylethanolamine/phosphatidyl-N-methylethanolamine N-methyltransferase